MKSKGVIKEVLLQYCTDNDAANLVLDMVQLPNCCICNTRVSSENCVICGQSFCGKCSEDPLEICGLCNEPACSTSHRLRYLYTQHSWVDVPCMARCKGCMKRVCTKCIESCAICDGFQVEYCVTCMNKSTEFPIHCVTPIPANDEHLST